MRIKAVRGAVTVPSDDKESIVSHTSSLLSEMMARNSISKEDLVSIIFTATVDLVAEFPAAAARSLGISDVPLLCATEIDVKGAIPRCVRVMMHVYTDLEYDRLRHVYLGDARQLRTDLRE
jgi:chorismate mutase